MVLDEFGDRFADGSLRFNRAASIRLRMKGGTWRARSLVRPKNIGRLSFLNFYWVPTGLFYLNCGRT